MRRLALLAVLAVLGALAAAAAPARAAPPDAIRAGGPSAPADAKVAIVGTSRQLDRARFTVVDATGKVVLRGRLAPATGSPEPWTRAYAADLSAVRAPGSYVVRVGQLRSGPWRVVPSGSRKALQTVLRFFAANADGTEQSPLHGPSHLNDAIVADGPLAGQRLDLTGGWMDAGDTLKFVQTTGFAAWALQVAARLDAADAAALNAAADVGVRWLVKAHPQPGVFVAQIGDQRDHETGFRRPDRDDGSTLPGIGTRPAYTWIAGDSGGRAAAALALAAARVTGPGREALLLQAREWYAAAVAVGDARPVQPGDYYPESDPVDELAVAAAALYRVTGEPAYLEDALTRLRALDPAGFIEVPSIGAFAAADLCGALGAPPVADEAARVFACDWLASAAGVGRANVSAKAFGTAGAFYWGHTGVNGLAGAIAAAAGIAGVAPDGLALAASARDYLLGRNQWGASFVVGYGRKPARNPHHWGHLVRRGEPIGAVVGGPVERAAVTEQGFKVRGPFDTDAAVYEDRRDNYVTSEPAIDYSAATVLLLAALAPR